MANITREEARQRAALLEVHTYDIDLDLTGGDAQFGTRSTIAFACAEPGARTFLEMTGTVRAVTLNGTALDLGNVVKGDRIELTELATDNTVTVVADGDYSHSGEGLHRFVDPEDDAVYLYSQCAVYDAQRIFACFDQPDLKARFTVSVAVPPEWTVLANTVPALTSAGRVTFAETESMSTYLVAVCAGDYVGVHDQHDGIELGLWCRRALAPHLAAEEIFSYTKQGFDHYHRLFAVPYAFGKYDQVMVPEFNLGAMENPGCVTFREELFVHRSRVTDVEHELLAQVITHEMAHMWFGDLVTMRWWDDLWLNESFADYLCFRTLAEATRFTQSWTSFCASRKAQGYSADQRPTTHPIAGNPPDVESALMDFDGISYAKGASVLKQLVAWIGDEAFLGGLRDYFAEHAWGNTVLADLTTALTAASGRDVAGWSEAWLQNAGVNTLRARSSAADDRTYASLEVLQEATDEHPTLRPHRIGIGVYDRRDGALVRRRLISTDVDGAATAVPELVGEPVPDLLLLNDDDLTFAKVRLDDRSLATVRESLDLLPESLPRALCWAALWDMVRDAEVPVSDFVRLAVRALPTESHVSILRRVLDQARAGIDLYAAAEHRDALLAALAAGALAHVCAAEPGGDIQLVQAQCFVRSAGAGDAPVLKGWLVDADVPAGLALDPELRWLVVQRLAVLGELDADGIDAEHAADRSQAGDLAAVHAHAALPDPGAKAAAWSALFADDTMTNARIEAVGEGFWQAEQVDVLRPYVERFFRDVIDIPDRRTAYMTLALTSLGYPALLVEEPTLRASTDFLAGPKLDTLVRRMVTERHSDLVRALAARTCDAQA